MRYFSELIQKYIDPVVDFPTATKSQNKLRKIHYGVDFHFALAIIAILGTAGSLYLQFNQANTEFDTLNASMSSIIRSQTSDLRENVSLNQEFDEMEKSLDALILN